ncbi:helix-turn-helix domain-containing protein [Streptomyces sp. NPDC015139]|uniref:helix-turn-helix domain-containing protein n=1 Tax=Streptomyces sp. NPDC015139 TaxID=3364942 RepID=UPI0036F50265
MSLVLYDFDTAKLQAARTCSGVSVAQIACAVGVTERAVNLWLAGTRMPVPEVLPRLAVAVGTTPAGLCTVEAERLVHLRVFTGRTRAQMADALEMAEKTYRLLESTGCVGRGARSRYSPGAGGWLPWEAWAAPAYRVTPERLAAATEASRAFDRQAHEERWEQIREADPGLAARYDTVVHDIRMGGRS